MLSWMLITAQFTDLRYPKRKVTSIIYLFLLVCFNIVFRSLSLVEA